MNAQTDDKDEAGGGLGPAQFKGQISGTVPANLYGIWTIGGRQIRVTEDTIIQFKKGAEAVPGAWVHVVTAPPVADGTIADATLIQVWGDAKWGAPAMTPKPAEKGQPEMKGKPAVRGKSGMAPGQQVAPGAKAGNAAGRGKGNNGKGPKH